MGPGQKGSTNDGQQIQFFVSRHTVADNDCRGSRVCLRQKKGRNRRHLGFSLIDIVGEAHFCVSQKQKRGRRLKNNLYWAVCVINM